MPGVTTDRRQGITAAAAVKVPVKCATTANITLSGEQTIDGVATSENRVLVGNQTDATENGIYLSGTSDWTREPDFDGQLDVKKGTIVYVTDGDTQTGWWTVTTSDPITPGVTSISFSAATVTSVAASDVSVEDADGNFSASTKTAETIFKEIGSRNKTGPHLWDYITSDTERGYIQSYDVASQDADANVTALAALKDDCVASRLKGTVPGGEIAVNAQFWLFDGATTGSSTDDQVCNIQGAGYSKTIFTPTQSISSPLIDIQNCWRHSSEANGISPTNTNSWDPDVVTEGVTLGNFTINGDTDYEIDGIRLFKICDGIRLHDIDFDNIKGCALNIGYDTTQTVPGTFDGVTGYGTVRESEFERLNFRHCGYYNSGTPALSKPAMWVAHGSSNGDSTNSCRYYNIRMIYPRWRGIHMLNTDSADLRRQIFFYLWLHGYGDLAPANGATIEDLFLIEGNCKTIQIHSLIMNGTTSDSGEQRYAIKTASLGGYTPGPITVMGWDAKTCNGGVYYFKNAAGVHLHGGSYETVSIAGEIMGLGTNAIGRPLHIDALDQTTTGINGRNDQTCTFTNATNLVTVTDEIFSGTVVKFDNSGGALPTGLNNWTHYWWVWQSATTGKLATTRELAEAGTDNVTFSDDGTGTHTLHELHFGGRAVEMDWVHGAIGNTSGSRTTLDGWYADNLPASTTTTMSLRAGGSNPTAHKIERDCFITRLHMDLSAAISDPGSSNLTLSITVGGSQVYRTTMTPEMGAENSFTIGHGSIFVPAGSLVEVDIITDGSWSDTTHDASASIEITI